MSAWREKRISSPFKSLNFLENSEKLIRTSFSLDDFTNLDQLLLIFQALTTHLLVSTSGKIKSLLEKGHNEFQVINKIQTMIMMPFPSMGPKLFWTVQIILVKYQSFWTGLIHFGWVQILLDSRPNHFGQVQIIKIIPENLI